MEVGRRGFCFIVMVSFTLVTGYEVDVDFFTAGRDRTGVTSGLLLALAGTDAETIELDFLLSRVGTEPAREQLLAFALHGSGAESIEAPGFRNMCNLRVSCWRRFVQGLERVHGGWEGYVTGTLGFSEDEVRVIKRNLAREE